MDSLHLPPLMVFAGIALSACTATSPNTASTGYPSSSASASDISQCEAIVRSMWQSADIDPYAGEPVRSLWRKDIAMFMAGKDPGYGINPVIDSHDDAPEILTFGPGYAEASRIVVPLVLQFKTLPGNPNEKPFNKSFIFSQEEGSWRLQDIKTDGRDGVSESLVQELKRIDASR